MLKGFTEIHRSTFSGGHDLQNTDNINNIYQFKKKYISVAAGGICFFYLFIFSSSMQTFSCVMWDLVPWPGIEPRPPTLGEQSINHQRSSHFIALWCIQSTSTYIQPFVWYSTVETSIFVWTRPIATWLEIQFISLKLLNFIFCKMEIIFHRIAVGLKWNYTFMTCWKHIKRAIRLLGDAL